MIKDIVKKIKKLFKKPDLSLEYDTGYEIAIHNLKHLRKYKNKTLLNTERKYYFLLSDKEKEEIGDSNNISDELNNKLKQKWIEIIDDMIFFFEYSLSPASFITKSDDLLKNKRKYENLEKRYKKAGNYIINYYRDLWD